LFWGLGAGLFHRYWGRRPTFCKFREVFFAGFAETANFESDFGCIGVLLIIEEDSFGI